ncbi:MAG TPA: hypothetical protein VGH10_12120 [Actinomycetota bacterium]|jgi:nitrous oxide reductase
MDEEKMSKVSRRTFIKRSAAGAAGVAAVGALGGTPAAAAAALGSKRRPAPQPPGQAAAQHVVAYVRAGSTGQVRVMAGDREVVVRDRDLARRLLRAAR